MTTPAAPDDIPTPDDPPQETLACEIEHLSADGRPAHPAAGPGHIALMLIAVGVVIVLVGISAGLWLGPLAGVSIGGLGLVLFVVSPAFWASISRARDRARARRRLDGQERVTRCEQRAHAAVDSTRSAGASD